METFTAQEGVRIMRRSTPGNRVAVVTLGVVLSVLTSGLAAQAQTVTGNIGGTVRDQQGAVVPNAAVSATNSETGAQRTALSDASGSFSVISLSAGTYDVTVSVPGFQTEVRSGIKLTVGAVLRLDFSL